MQVECNVHLYVGMYMSGVEPFSLCYSVFVPLHSVMWSGVEPTYIRRYVREWSGTMPYQELFFKKKKYHGQFVTCLRGSCRILMGVRRIGRVA
jgi:hypothetical protein